MDTTKNISANERFFRGVLGASLVSWALNGNGPGWWGLVVLLTAITEFCPLYHYFGISTRPRP